MKGRRVAPRDLDRFKLIAVMRESRRTIIFHGRCSAGHAVAVGSGCRRLVLGRNALDALSHADDLRFVGRHGTGQQRVIRALNALPEPRRPLRACTSARSCPQSRRIPYANLCHEHQWHAPRGRDPWRPASDRLVQCIGSIAAAPRSEIPLLLRLFVSSSSSSATSRMFACSRASASANVAASSSSVREPVHGGS